MFVDNITRDEFMNIFKELDLFIYNQLDCVYNIETDDTKIWCWEETNYILHKESGTLVSWYKNLGRAHCCNKKFTLDDYKEFANKILSDLKECHERGYI